MEYLGDVFHTFMGLDSAIYLTVTSLPVFIQHILNCVLKTNKAFTGSERHGGVENDNFHFGVEYPFKMEICAAKNVYNYPSGPAERLFTDGIHHTGLACVGFHSNDILETVQGYDSVPSIPDLQDVLHF